jgi:hypothetical protein
VYVLSCWERKPCLKWEWSAVWTIESCGQMNIANLISINGSPEKIDPIGCEILAPQVKQILTLLGDGKQSVHST